MATYYSSSTGQRDSMHTLYSKEQQRMHSDPSVDGGGSMMYMHYPSLGAYSDILAGTTGSQENGIDLPASTNMISQNSSMLEPGSIASHILNTGYDGAREGRNEMSFIQMVGGSMNGRVDFIQSSVSSHQQMGLQNSCMQQGNISSVHGQGLSLSLGTEIPVSSFQYPHDAPDFSILNSHQSTLVTGGSCRGDDSRNILSSADLSSCALSNILSTIPSSKYLKVAQRLLDEVVNVQTARYKVGKSQGLNNSPNTSCKDNDGSSKTDGMQLKTEEPTSNSSRVLSSSEKQDFQSKLAKLLTMLDEVDKRYKIYHQQMQIIVSSFDAISGCGAAKPYTSLALQTISRQFRNLKDAINGQIRATRNSLGEQDSLSSKGGVITRLRYVDQHLRQQRAIQQIGLYQQHVWRPQRGLPETSVSILRAWLFEHFLHPYPTEAEKLMLARQTGLTRSQISNWFINARVRLWKPMIEDIYKEEMGNAELDTNSSENAPNGRHEIKSSKEQESLQSSIAEGSHMDQFNESPRSRYGSNPGNGTMATDFHNNATASNAYEQRPNEEDCGALHGTLTHNDASARLMAHQMVEMEKYGSSGVSLTLGLQHCIGGLPMSHDQQGFVTLRGEGIYSTAPPLGSEVADYDCMNLPDQRHRFGPPHLLHDFVA